jgi:hypothetical protein
MFTRSISGGANFWERTAKAKAAQRRFSGFQREGIRRGTDRSKGVRGG